MDETTTREEGLFNVFKFHEKDEFDDVYHLCDRRNRTTLGSTINFLARMWHTRGLKAYFI